MRKKCCVCACQDYHVVIVLGGKIYALEKVRKAVLSLGFFNFSRVSSTLLIYFLKMLSKNITSIIEFIFLK